MTLNIHIAHYLTMVSTAVSAAYELGASLTPDKDSWILASNSAESDDTNTIPTQEPTLRDGVLDVTIREVAE